MNFTKTSVLAFWISIVISILYAIIGTVISYSSQNPSYNTILLLTPVILFAVVYFLLKYSFEKFIYEKIKPIYKTIISQKSQRNKAGRKTDRNFDDLSAVNQQVIKWAEDKKEEIEVLKKQEAFRREFIGNVSHELKTPIFNIQGYVLTLLDGGLEDESINRDFLLRTEKSINRMITIVEDLDTISKLESGEILPEITKFDIVSVAREVFDFLEMNAIKKSISLNFGQNSEKPVYVSADKEKIRQVLTNLVDNSIKYGNNGGYTKISFYDMDENILIEVADNGIGVEQKEISRLFERFYRTDKSRSRDQGGSGLGLSIVKHIIEAHQQTINVRSSIGVGTTFSFTLNKG